MSSKKPGASAKPAAKAKVSAKASAKPAAKVVGKAGGKASAKLTAKPPVKGGKAAPAVTQELLKVERRAISRPKQVHVGGDLPPKGNVDLTRFTRWPRYVWRQRRTRVLQARLKIPPSIHQFSRALDSDQKKAIFRFAAKYAPESKAERKARMTATAAAKAKGGKGASAAPKRKPSIRCGLKCVTRLIEHKRAKLVLIASDVSPIELVMFLPALCRKQGVPYAIVKGKAQLGKLVGFKEAAAVAFDTILPEDTQAFSNLVATVDTSFAKDPEHQYRKWGGLQLGRKSRDKLRIQRAAAKKQEEQMRTVQGLSR